MGEKEDSNQVMAISVSAVNLYHDFCDVVGGGNSGGRGSSQGERTVLEGK